MKRSTRRSRHGWLAAAVVATMVSPALAQEGRPRGLATGIAPASMPTTFPSFDVSGPSRTITSPVVRERAVLAVVGPIAGGSAEDLRTLARDLDLVRPDAVITTGDMIAGFATSAEAYSGQSKDLRAVLDAMKTPWYPCVGSREITGATLDIRDPRLALAYEKEFGPRWYSIDVGDVHAVVLDSQERVGGPPLFSAVQLEWLRQDLRSVFERRRARQVIVVTHRPAWRDKDSNWTKVEEQLIAFNRRPIVTIEGAPGDQSKRRGPRVAMVFAASEDGYTQEDPREGIGYYVIGPARAKGDRNVSAGRFGQFALVELSAGESRVSVVEAGHVHAGDMVTAPERQLLSQIESLDAAAMGVQGSLNQPVGMDAGTLDLLGTGLKVVLTNPLKTSIDVEVRLAGDGLGVWEIAAESLGTRLRAGEKSEYKLGLCCGARTTEVSPPELEFCVRLKGTRGREMETILRRRVPLLPSATMMAFPKVDDRAWKTAARHGLWAFEPSKREGAGGSFAIRADAARLYVRLKVEGSGCTYLPRLNEPWNLPTDAVTVSWADDRKTDNAEVQRIVVLPFAPEGQRLLTNRGVGRNQTALTLLNTRACPAEIKVTRAAGGYELELSLPRQVVLAGQHDVVMNVGAFISGNGASEFRSWSSDVSGPAGWAVVRLVEPSPPASQPTRFWLPIPFWKP